MTTLKAEKRSMDVKAKRLRREGYVTGNVFGKKIQGSIPVKMEKKDVDRLLKTETKGGQIMLDVEGEVYDVLIKEVDYNAMTRKIDEIDFQALVSTEKVTSTAEIVILNREAVIGGVLQEDLSEVAYKAFPSALVETTTLDAAGLKVGDTVHVKDLEIAKNKDIDLKTDPEAVVLSVIPVHNVVPETEVTTAPAAIIAHFPIVCPHTIVAFAPTVTPSFNKVFL